VVASDGSVYESFFNAWRAPPPPGISWPALNIGASNQVAILYGIQPTGWGILRSCKWMTRSGMRALDPDSYEYFQHYYLQPRALASAYERLAPYYPYFPYPYGYPPGQPSSGGPAMPR